MKSIISIIAFALLVVDCKQGAQKGLIVEANQSITWASMALKPLIGFLRHNLAVTAIGGLILIRNMKANS